MSKTCYSRVAVKVYDQILPKTITLTVLVIIAVSSVAVCQFTRRESDLHGIELEDGSRSDKHWPSSILNKKKRRRKKNRKTKAREPDVTNYLEGEEVEEVESFEEDNMVNNVGMGGVSGSGQQQQQQQHTDVPKVSGLCRIFLYLATRCGVIFFFAFSFYLCFASTSCFSSYSLRPLLIANAMQLIRPRLPSQNSDTA